MSIDYRWRCTSCDKVNKAGTAYCEHCESPAEVCGILADRWNKSETAGPERPYVDMVDGLLWNDYTTGHHYTLPCHFCKNLMYISDRNCPHCGIPMKEGQRGIKHRFYIWRRKHAMLAGAIFTTGTIMLIVGITAMFEQLQ